MNIELSSSQAVHKPSPLVSIVVISYNHELFIDECLQSCILQLIGYENIQIVVSDDGSTDATQQKILNWAEKYPEIITPVISEFNSGIAANINRGINAARGDMIAWLGGDDILYADKVGHQVEFLIEHPDASGCYHDAEVFAWPSGKILGLFSKLYAGKAANVSYIDVEKMLDCRYQMLPSTIMIRRNCMPKEFDTRLRFHNDYLFDLQTIIYGGPFVRMDGIYTRYRKHEKSVGADPVVRSMMLEENLMVMSILEARFPRLSWRIKKRAIYYISIEAIKSRLDGDHQRTRNLCVAMLSRGAWLKAAFVFLFSGSLSHLAKPKYRAFAIKLRSIFG